MHDEIDPATEGRNGEIDAAGDADNHVMGVGSTPQKRENFPTANALKSHVVCSGPFSVAHPWNKCCCDQLSDQGAGPPHRLI
jgi:hypothetical protein